MKKIAPGYYQLTYKEQDIKISKVEAQPYWYHEINDGVADDWYSTKKEALLAAKEVIDNPEQYIIK